MASLGYKPVPVDQESQDRIWDSVWNGLDCSARTCPPVTCGDEGKIRSWIREWEGDLRWLWSNQITVRPPSVSIKMPPPDLWKQFVEVNCRYKAFKEVFPDEGWRKEFADVDEFVQKSFNKLLGNGPSDRFIGSECEATEDILPGSPAPCWPHPLSNRNSPESDGYGHHCNHTEPELRVIQAHAGKSPSTPSQDFGMDYGFSDSSDSSEDEFADNIILPGTPMPHWPPSPVIGSLASQDDGHVDYHGCDEARLPWSAGTTPPTLRKGPFLEQAPIQILTSPVLPQAALKSHFSCSCRATRKCLPSEQRIDQLIEQRQRSIERRQAEILRLQGEVLHAVSDIAGWMTVKRTMTPIHITSYN